MRKSRPKTPCEFLCRILFFVAGALFSLQTQAAPGVVDIQDLAGYSAAYAISDVHGMPDSARALLASAGLLSRSDLALSSQALPSAASERRTGDDIRWTGGRALLIVVGDSIDKGPKSLEVLDLWISLSKQALAQGGRVVHLLGNHEAEFLADPQGDRKAAELIAELHDRGLPLDDVTSPSSPHGAFLAAEPLAARVGKWLFCHAGLFPSPNWASFERTADALLNKQNYSDPFLIGDDSILEAREWEKSADGIDDAKARLDAAGFAGVVFGHQPKAFGAVGRIASAADGRIIKIDTGMAPEAGAHAGEMLKFPNPTELATARLPTTQIVSP